MTWLIIVLFIIVANAAWFVGLWNSVLTLISLLLSGLIACSFYENLAKQLENSMPTYVYLTEFISIWVLFGFSYLLLRGFTELLSWHRVKFDKITEYVGRTVVAIWIAYAFVGFVGFTLHMAPLPPHAYQVNTNDRMMGIVSPDRQWMAFVQSRSRGALSESQKTGLFGAYTKTEHPDDAGKNLRVFDPQSKFVFDHHLRRQQISESKTLRTRRQR